MVDRATEFSDFAFSFVAEELPGFIKIRDSIMEIKS